MSQRKEELAIEQTWQQRPISFAGLVGVEPLQAWVQDARKQILHYKRGTPCCMNSFLSIVKRLQELGQTLLGPRTKIDLMKENASFNFYESHELYICLARSLTPQIIDSRSSTTTCSSH